MQVKIEKLPLHIVGMGELAIMAGRTPTAKEWKTWVLEDSARILVSPGGDRAGYRITIEAGFMTDFASIPWMFRAWQTGAVGPQRAASYFHDYLYHGMKSNRREADKIFREVMKAADPKGVRRWFRRWTMWLALRVGGYGAYVSGQRSLTAPSGDRMLR